MGGDNLSSLLAEVRVSCTFIETKHQLLPFHLYSIHGIHIMAFTWIPSSMQWVHKPLIGKAKEQTEAQEQGKHQPS
jgi:hypothetical protein